EQGLRAQRQRYQVLPVRTHGVPRGYGRGARRHAPPWWLPHGPHRRPAAARRHGRHVGPLLQVSVETRESATATRRLGTLPRVSACLFAARRENRTSAGGRACETGTECPFAAPETPTLSCRGAPPSLPRIARTHMQPPANVPHTPAGTERDSITR